MRDIVSFFFFFFECFSWLSFVDARLPFQVNHEKCIQVGWSEMSIEKSKQSGRCWRGSWCDKSCGSWQRLQGWEEGGVRHGKRGAHYKVKFAQPYALGNGSKTHFIQGCDSECDSWCKVICGTVTFAGPCSLHELFPWFKPCVTAFLSHGEWWQIHPWAQD